MRKFLSLFLAVTLAFTSLSLCVFPATESKDGSGNEAQEGTISVSSVRGGRGSTVLVDIGLLKNPGVSALQLRVDFDEDLLTLTGAEDKGLLGSTDLSQDYASPYLMTWINTDAVMSTATGTLCTLEFFVPYTLSAGDEVSVSVSCVSAYDTDYQAVTFAEGVGTVTAEAFTRGDLNEADGVTSADAIYLLYSTVFPGRYPLPEGMDVDFNADREVNSADAIYLLYHTVFPARYPL